jgi:hypothetical protein
MKCQSAEPILLPFSSHKQHHNIRRKAEATMTNEQEKDCDDIFLLPRHVKDVLDRRCHNSHIEGGATEDASARNPPKSPNIRAGGVGKGTLRKSKVVVCVLVFLFLSQAYMMYRYFEVEEMRRQERYKDLLGVVGKPGDVKTAMFELGVPAKTRCLQVVAPTNTTLQVIYDFPGKP